MDPGRPQILPGDLSGNWTFRRRLGDLVTGQFGSARGTLEVDAGRRSWAEQGRLDWNGRRAAVTRTMRFLPVDGEWWMTFADGRPFHPWRLGEVLEHRCRADVYRGVLAVDDGPGRLRICWDVVGPGKHQRIVTRYDRVSPACDGEAAGP
jgi:hypothetical protein